MPCFRGYWTFSTNECYQSATFNAECCARMLKIQSNFTVLPHIFSLVSLFFLIFFQISLGSHQFFSLFHLALWFFFIYVVALRCFFPTSRFCCVLVTSSVPEQEVLSGRLKLEQVTESSIQCCLELKYEVVQHKVLAYPTFTSLA